MTQPTRPIPRPHGNPPDVASGKRLGAAGAQPLAQTPAPPRVLVVRDEPEIGQVLALAVKAAGYLATLATNGRQDGQQPHSPR